MLAPGTTLNNRYTILSLLASGGMGNLYLASDSHLSGNWIVKEMSDIFPNPRDREAIIEQFRREAAILSTLSHENLPRVIDYFSLEGAHYLVEEYIPGSTLANLSLQRRFSEDEAIDLGCQILKVLDYLHQNKIIYRDIKPQNILHSSSGKYKLIDFGIARLYSVGKHRDTVLMGTPGFAAPEHYGNRQTDERSDIYSLGATLHYLITGKDPALSPFQFRPPCIINHEVSKWLSDIIMVATEPRPEERFQSAHEMLEVIGGPKGVAIRAREFHYPEKLPLFPKRDRPLQCFAGIVAVAGIGLTIITGYVPLVAGSTWFLGMGMINAATNVEKRNTAYIATPRELIVNQKSHKKHIPWEEIQAIRVIKYQSLLRTKKPGEQASDDTIRVGVIEVFHSTLPMRDSLKSDDISSGEPLMILLRSGSWLNRVIFTSELQRWEELLKTIITRAKLKSTGIPGNPLADEVYLP